jgi:hypothetical protein
MADENPWVRASLGSPESFDRAINDATGTTKEQRRIAIDEKIERNKFQYELHIAKLRDGLPREFKAKVTKPRRKRR